MDEEGGAAHVEPVDRDDEVELARGPRVELPGVVPPGARQELDVAVHVRREVALEDLEKHGERV